MTLLPPELSCLHIHSLPHQSWTSFGNHGQQQHTVEPSSYIRPHQGGDCGTHHLPQGGLQYNFFPHVHQHCDVSF